MTKIYRTSLASLLLTLLIVPFVPAQQPQDPDVVRTNIELVQSAVRVVDKSGQFVEGLKREQFELVIDGASRPIASFERIGSGAQLVKETVAVDSTDPVTTQKPRPRSTGRTIVFFIDDLHLSAESLHRTRQMLHKFLETEFTSSDNVALATASGQVGFLEQFTNNREVLVAAIEKLLPRPYFAEATIVGSNTRLTEYMALHIETSKSDDKVLKFYVEECMRGASTFKKAEYAKALVRASCETQVKNGARSVLMQAGQVTQNTYNSLESLLKSAGRAPGRKLAYFVSDGFLLDGGPHAAATRDKLEHVIESAQRGGVVVYTIHAQGLVNSSYLDPKGSRPADGAGRLDMAQVGEIQAYQDALHALASDTGGRALRNTNFFDRWVTATLDEASNYYVIAWRPENVDEKEKKFHNVKINVIGRPDLTVRASRGFIDTSRSSAVAVDTKSQTPKTPDKQLKDALSDFFPTGDVPAVLSLTYLNTPANGPVVTSSIQVGSSGISYGEDGKQQGMVRLAGVVLNDKGKIVSSFGNQLKVIAPQPGEQDIGVLYSERTPVTPGIYQVRVAARDENSARVGSAIQWIVVPDLNKGKLLTSSLLLGGQLLDDQKNKANNPKVQLTGNHMFASASKLPFWLFVYNAKPDGKGMPHLTIQTIVERDGKTIIASPLRAIDNIGADSLRIPFGDELALKTLTPGRYDLTVKVKDNVAGASVSQSSYFYVR